jgi:phage baseplate assembly protein W
MELLNDLLLDDDFTVSAQGDFALVEGVANVRQALLHRLLTTPGTVVHRPEYGVGIQDYLNSPLSFDTKRKMAVAIQGQFLNDSRVAEVKTIQIQDSPENPSSVTLLASVLIDGSGDAILQFDIG